MRRSRLISRLTTFVLGLVACLLFAILTPLMLDRGANDEPFSANSVMALPRDLYVVTAPVRLSEAPYLTITRGVLYADGNAALGMPISKFVLDGPVFYLNVSGLRATTSTFEGSFTRPDAGPIAPLLEQLAAMSFDTLSIQRGTVYITAADGTSETIGDLRAELTGRRKGVIASRGSFTIRGQTVAFDATLAPAPDKRAAVRWPTKISLKAPLIEASFDGYVDVTEDVRFAGQMDVTMPSVRRVARWFGVPIPNTAGLNPASLKGRFSWSRRTLAMEDAKITVDGNEAGGTLFLNLARERPLVEGTLAFSALDLSPYLEATRSQYPIFDRLRSSWSPFDLSFPVIKYVDADLRLSSQTIALKGFTFGRGAASITAHAGKLLANIVELELHSGTASAQLSADTNALTPRYTLRGKVDNFDAGPASAALWGSSVLHGRSALSFDLASSGQTIAEVLRNVSGSASLNMAEGGRATLDLKGIRALSKDNATPGWGPLVKGQANLEHLEARAVIVGGVVFCDNIQARAGATALATRGTLDLAEGTLDLHLSVKPASAAERPAAPPEGEVISVHGPWSAPTLRTEDSAAEAASKPN